jgi:hypothetical protein
MKKLWFVLLITCVALIQGCTTLADARKAEGEGVKKTYQADYEKTWNVVIKSISKLKLELASENKTDGYVLAQRGMGVLQMSYGENVAIFIKSKSKTETTVEVVSKKVMTTNIFAPDWSEDIHKEILLALKQ